MRKPRDRDGPERKQEKATIKKIIRDAIKANKNFENFLCENNCYGRYIRNVTNRILSYPSEQQNRIQRTLNNIAIGGNASIINSTLCWNDTPEGWEYWNKIFSNRNKKSI